MTKALFTFLNAGTLLTLSAAAFAAGTTSADFLKLGVGARNIAMGETGAAETSVYASYWNPAGLARLERPEFAFTYGAWLANITYRYAAYAQKTSIGTWGASVDYVSVPSIQKYDNTGAAQNDFYSPSNSAFSLSYAATVARLPVGVNIKAIHEQIDDASAQSVAADVGVLLDPLLGARNDLSVGLAVQNIGPGMKFVQETDPLPLNVRLGAAYRYSPAFILAADADKAKDEDLSLHFGAEYVMNAASGAAVACRLGYQTDRQGLGGLAGAGFGLGIEHGPFAFDYALTPFADLGLVHRASVKVRF